MTYQMQDAGVDLRYSVVTGPASEPVTSAEAKKHCEIATGDSTHDTQITDLIEAARQQFEKDTGELLISRTLRITTDVLQELQFPHRPVTAISSLLYYDLDNAQQTLSTNVYALDSVRSQLRLKYAQVWPNTLERWDAVEINYTAGTHTDESTVPFIAKQAMLLLIGYYFDGNRGDDDGPHDQRAYEALVRRYIRSTYP